jgi:predicted DNA-binding transcriptional regulator AlpA
VRAEKKKEQNKQNKTVRLRKHNVDRRADMIFAAATAQRQAPPPALPSASSTPDADQLLSTPAVAAMLGVSEQWMEQGRKKGWGPPFQKLAPRCVRYRRGDVLEWLKQRSAMFAERKGAEHAA